MHDQTTSHRRPSRGRPKKYAYRYGNPTSAQRGRRSKVKQALSVNEATKAVLRRINQCGTIAVTNEEASCSPQRCNHRLCHDCHHHFQLAQINETKTAFEKTGKDEIFFVTLLADPLARISTPPTVECEDVYSFADCLLAVRALKDAVEATLVSSDVQTVIVKGWLEFAHHTRRNGAKSHNERYIRSWNKTRCASASAIGANEDPVLILHAHLLIHIRKDGKALKQKAITALLKQTFCHPYQVSVKSLRKKQTKEEAITNVVSYSTKYDTKHSPTHIAELSLLWETCHPETMTICLDRDHAASVPASDAVDGAASRRTSRPAYAMSGLRSKITLFVRNSFYFLYASRSKSRRPESWIKRAIRALWPGNRRDSRNNDMPPTLPPPDRDGTG